MNKLSLKSSMFTLHVTHFWWIHAWSLFSKRANRAAGRTPEEAPSTRLHRATGSCWPPGPPRPPRLHWSPRGSRAPWIPRSHRRAWRPWTQRWVQPTVPRSHTLEPPTSISTQSPRWDVPLWGQVGEEAQRGNWHRPQGPHPSPPFSSHPTLPLPTGSSRKAPEVKPLLEMPGVQPFMLWGPAPY